MNSAAYIRAIRGPVLLIVLGTLMLLDHRTELSFWRTWPLLLVAGGLIVLAERAAIRENPWAAVPPVPHPQPPSTIPYRPFGHTDPEPPRTTGSGSENPPMGGPQA
jgi:hypothetical protein